MCVCVREREKECVGWYSIFSFPHIKGAINFSLLSLAECNTHTRAAGRLGPDLANTQDELIYQVAHSRTRASPTRLSGEWEIKLETERVETRRAFIRRKRCTGEREKEVRGRLKPKYTRRREETCNLNPSQFLHVRLAQSGRAKEILASCKHSEGRGIIDAETISSRFVRTKRKEESSQCSAPLRVCFPLVSKTA